MWAVSSMLIVASFLSSSILNTFIFPHLDVRLHSLGVVVRVGKTRVRNVRDG